VSPVKYKLGFYIQEDDILHSHRRENLKSYIVIEALTFRRNRRIIILRMVCSGMLRRVALVRTDVSEEQRLLHQGDKNR
jgi:hypothetical protein